MKAPVKPFFSVIIPTYNCAKKLSWTLDSVTSQSFRDFEVLVMDDGSTDNTKVVVESFHDPRIHYAWAPNSGGPATPRNRGIKAASADWICFLDADDIWYPAKLDVIADEIARNPNVDLLCNNEFLSLVGVGKKLLLRYGPFERNFYRIMLLEGNRVSTSATTVRRAFLTKHALSFNQSPDYVIVEDYDLWLRIALFGGRFHFIDTPLGEYVIDDGNISSNLTKLQRNRMTLLRDHTYRIQTFELDKDRLWKRIYARELVTSAKNMIMNNKFSLGVDALRLAFFSSFTSTSWYILSKTTSAVRASISKSRKWGAES